MHTTLSADIWQALGGLAIVLSLVGSVALWALKEIIRGELDRFKLAFTLEVIEPIRRDIRTLQDRRE